MPSSTERGTWILVVRVKAEDENDARSKLTDDVPYMLVNGFNDSGNTHLTLIGPDDA